MNEQSTSIVSIFERRKPKSSFRQDEVSQLVSRITGKSELAQRNEIVRLRHGVGQLSAAEYYYYGLYDDSRFTQPAKEKFLGAAAQRQILKKCSAAGWRGIVHDKIVLHLLMEAYGFPVPKTVALFDRQRHVPKAALLRNEIDLSAFLRSCEQYPLFGKPVNGMYSLGSVRLESYDRNTDTLEVYSGRRLSVDSFVQELSLFSRRGYLFQEVKHPHSKIEVVCGDRLACVRVVILKGPGKPEIFRALWKIPVGPNLADNFWRGNLIANLDVTTGRLTHIIQGVGLNRLEIERHPDSGVVLRGFELPYWVDVKDLSVAAATEISGLAMQAWDIAICREGPVIIEANVGGDFNLPQLATGSGLLDDQFLQFLIDHKWLNATHVKARSSIGRS